MLFVNFQYLTKTMECIWVLLFVLLGYAQAGKRVPRQYVYDKAPQDGVVSLTHSNPFSVAICSLVSSAGYSVSGDIVFRQENAEDPVEITGMISGLAPGYHGFHVHQNANLSDNCKGAGPHFNPENVVHGAPHDYIRHVGDLGNIPADENGASHFQFEDKQISLYNKHPKQILGRAIVVHEKEDDLGRGNNEESKKTGNAGARVACCIIKPVDHSTLYT